jgi:hypothetical protein
MFWSPSTPPLSGGRRFSENLEGLAKSAEEGAAHAFSIAKASFLDHDLHRQSALFEKEFLLFPGEASRSPWRQSVPSRPELRG